MSTHFANFFYSFFLHFFISILRNFHSFGLIPADTLFQDLAWLILTKVNYYASQSLNHRTLHPPFTIHGGRPTQDRAWDYKDNTNTIFGVAWSYDLKMGQADDSYVNTGFTSKQRDYDDAAQFGNFNAGTPEFTPVFQPIDNIFTPVWEKSRSSVVRTMWTPEC